MQAPARPARARNTLGLLAVTSAIVGPAFAWLRLVPALVGFALFAIGGLLALLIGLASAVQALRGRGLTAGGGAALVLGIAFVALASRESGVPPINDFSTDTSDPPVFHHAATLPANAGRDMAYPADFAPQQQRCCADLHTARLAAAKDEAFRRALVLAEHTPAWTVTVTDPTAGIIEAIATTSLFGFQDDIVIRVRADGESGSHVDMRSKSRDGKGDMGTNAKRIRAYISQLEGTPGA